jgi:hypothetical protein
MSETTGDLMRRMAQIVLQLDELVRTGQPFAERATQAEPLKQELAELNRRLWGNGS